MYRRTYSLFNYIAALYYVLHTQLVGATAACPPDYNEWLHTATVDAATVQVCISNQDNLGMKQLQLTLSSKTQQLRSTVPLDIEGDLRAIELAPASYALQPGKRALALLLQVRNRGVSFDEERHDLWLFWPEAGQLRLVFNQSIELQHWATDCAQDCDDTVRSRSELKVLAKSTTQPNTTKQTTEQLTASPPNLSSMDTAPTAAMEDGAMHSSATHSGAKNSGELAPLELLSQGEVLPGGAEDVKPQPFSQQQRYEFNGERYELVQ